jgi:hypothetical protein
MFIHGNYVTFVKPKDRVDRELDAYEYLRELRANLEPEPPLYDDDMTMLFESELEHVMGLS